VLWRGPEVESSDVDVLVAPGRSHDVARVLRDAGLSPAPQRDGRVMWRSFDGDGVVIDAMPADAWPRHHPALDGFLARCRDAGAELPVASVADRLLIRGAEAVGGRPLAHLADRARPLLAQPGARERLVEVAAREDARALAELIMDIDSLSRAAAGGPLPWRLALRAAVRSPLARAALRARAAHVVGVVPRPAPPPGAGTGQGLVVALSGMDGSGKSTAALELVARLAERDRPAILAWNRLAAETEILDLIAAPVRRLLRRRRRTAEGDLMNAGQAGGRARSDVTAEQPSVGSRVVESAWVAIVAAISARSRRRAARKSHAGLVVVCDRWLVDALVDIEILYGHHRLAEWVLRRATPRADLAVLLEIDPATATRRKPGDQSEPVLERMAVRYAAVAKELGFPPAGEAPRAGKVRIDARGGQADVVAAIDAHVDAALAARA
jgi:thymidylate kinase